MPVAEPGRSPSGAAVTVISRSPHGLRYLLLRRADEPLDDSDDWAWGPPGGCLEPGEAVAACAARELYEETGIRGHAQPVATENIAWALFYLEVPWGTPVHLGPTEHDDFTWETFDRARQMCRPERVAAGFARSVEAAGVA